MSENRNSARKIADAGEVVDFWQQAGWDKWFTKDEAFDRVFREKFLDTHMAAAARQCDSWAEKPEGSLALMILLDQFPRNTFRGTGHMYATDPLARHFARRAIAAGQPEAVAEELRLFFYLPFTHSEDLTDQDFAVELNTVLAGPGLKYAEHHREIIREYGRFPHRNRILGRETTAKEAKFLEDGGFSG